VYQLRTPAASHRDFIEYYWFVTSDDAPVDLRVDVFVDGRADLIFNFGVPYLRELRGEPPREYGGSNLDAQRLAPIRITQRGLVRTLGVRFRLGGLGAYVRVPLQPWTDRTPAPSEVFGEAAIAVATELERTRDVDEQARLLDAFFAARLVVDARHETFDRALRALTSTDGRARVDEVAEDAGVSSRQVDRLFAHYLGIPPKTVGRILRFQNSLRTLMHDPGCALAEVAAAAGYFDQAHFIKDFKRMTGGVPRGYRGYYPPAAASDFAPNVVAFLQDDGGGPA